MGLARPRWSAGRGRSVFRLRDGSRDGLTVTCLPSRAFFRHVHHVTGHNERG